MSLPSPQSKENDWPSEISSLSSACQLLSVNYPKQATHLPALPCSNVLASLSQRTAEKQGESDDKLSPEGFLVESSLPKIARELPLPHLFVYSKSFSNDGGKGKPTPLSLTIDEVFAGSLDLARRSAASPEHSYVLAEYSDYLVFLAVKRWDYLAKSVLGFDADFRASARHEKCGLNDSRARLFRADRHFNSGTFVRPGGRSPCRLSNPIWCPRTFLRNR